MKTPTAMVTNMPRIFFSEISRFSMAQSAPGSVTPLPRQWNRLEVLAISRAACMPLPDTSAMAKYTRPSRVGK